MAGGVGSEMIERHHARQAVVPVMLRSLRSMLTMPYASGAKFPWFRSSSTNHDFAEAAANYHRDRAGQSTEMAA